MVTLDALRAIGARDPDEWSRRPTDEDYAEHKRWAVQTYGIEVWNVYRRGGWELPPEV